MNQAQLKEEMMKLEAIIERLKNMVTQDIGSDTFVKRAYNAWQKAKRAYDACEDLLDQMETECIGAGYEQTMIE